MTVIRVEKESSLPSIEDASKAIHKVDEDCEAWRDIVTLSIQYATNTVNGTPIRFSAKEDAGMAMNDSGEGDVDGRVKETVMYLLKSLNGNGLNDETDVEMEDNQDNANNTVANRRDLAESMLVDALWLSGTMLEPQTQTQTPENDEDATNTTNAYAALCKLTHDLTQTPNVNVSAETTRSAHTSKSPPKPLTPIPRRKLLTALEPRHLNASGILSDQLLQLFIKKIRKLNTDMYYRQKKVNLMQEESEGYAKFLRFLVNLPQVKDMDADVDADDVMSHEDIIQLAKLRITELIGTFDLDPNRCLDLTLDALEGEIRQSLSTLSNQQRQRGNANANANANVDLYKLIRNAPGSAMTVHVLLHIIQLFPVENVTHLIGFKYSAYAKKNEANTPQSLYLTTVILTSHQLLSLAALNPHLPPLQNIQDEFSKWKQKYQQKIKKLGVVSLNSSSKKTTDAAEDTSAVDSVGKKNQTIQLFYLLLEMGIEWDLAIGIFDASGDHGHGTKDDKKMKDITNYIAKCSCLYSPLGSTLCDILHRAIGPIYDAKVDDIGSSLCPSKEEEGEVAVDTGDYALLPRQLCNKKVMQLSADLSLVEILKKIESILEPIIVSGSMASNAILYTKLCRLVRSMLLESNSNETPIKEVDDQVLEFLERVLVSSFSLFPLNPAIASELWSVLSLLPYQIRYALYASWKKHGLGKAALRSMVQPPKPLAQVESEVNTGISTKYLLKRMSKDNIKDMGRQVSKVAHNNPLVVFTLMLNQIESYDNLILMMVDTFKFMGVLSLDVMGYCLLVSLGGEGEGRSKLKGEFHPMTF